MGGDDAAHRTGLAVPRRVPRLEPARTLADVKTDVARRAADTLQRAGEVCGDVDVAEKAEERGSRPANGVPAGDAAQPLHGPAPGHNDERGVRYGDAVVESVDEAGG